MQFLQHLIDVIPAGPAITVVIAGAVDFLLRLTKSEKPLSIAWLVSSFLHKLAEFSEKLAQFMDKVLPQKTKELEPPK